MCTKGGPNKVGPNLWGIVGAMHGVHEGFPYSDAMAAKTGEPWTYEALNEFLHGPGKGASRAPRWPSAASRRTQDRANLLAYLATLSDAPVPFPAP